MSNQKLIEPMSLLTYFVSNYQYQVVSFTGAMKLRGNDFWLVNPNMNYPVICISKDSMSRFTITNGPYRYVLEAIMSGFKKKGNLLILSLKI